MGQIFSLQAHFMCRTNWIYYNFTYLRPATMLINVVIAFTVFAAAVSAFDDNVGKVRKDGALHRHVVDCKPTMSNMAHIYSFNRIFCPYFYLQRLSQIHSSLLGVLPRKISKPPLTH